MNEEELAPKEDLPMVFPFKFKKYYVRKCYSLLFREICSSLEENDYITVTGTPGIGKSVFYMYVYRKLRIKYPDKVFVVATFDKRQLQNAFIFMSGQEKGKRLSSLEFETIADDNPGSFHLYDAAPKVKPDATMTKCKMITFTSPNPSWESSIRKVATHQYFYVDLWTFDELKKAKSMVEELKSIPNEELLNRFRISHFRRGGPFSEHGRRQLDAAISKVSSLTDVWNAINLENMSVDADSISHRLIYYIPEENDRTNYTLTFGSTWIAAKINEMLVKVEKAEMIRLKKQLDADPRCSVLSGWLFEAIVHQALSIGGDFSCRSLDADSNHNHEVSFSLTPSELVKLKTTQKINEIFDRMYLKPEANNLTAADSCYYSRSESILWIFQSTLSRYHAIKSAGLDTILRLLNLEQNFYDGILEIRLLFVVPLKISSKYQHQRIEVESTFPRFENLSDSLNIKGVKDTKRKILAENGIDCEKKLYAAVENGEVKRYSCIKQRAENFHAGVKEQRNSPIILESNLGAIKQFVMGISDDQ